MRLEQVFPYASFRQGQRELAESVYSACKNGNTIVVEAMSGFGKTAAVLAGALAAASEEGLEVVYACRTKRQVFRTLEELGRISTKLPLNATSLFAKYDYCLQRQKGFDVSPETFKWYCTFQTSNNLCSYFLNIGFNRDKVDRFVENLTHHAGSIAELIEKGNQLHVCPYEMARLSLARSKVTVTTYHYLLDQGSRTAVFPKDRNLSKVVAVIDEAHNIRDFMSGISTVSISLADIKESIADSGRLYLPRVSSAISEMSARIKEFWPKGDGWLLDKQAFLKAMTGGHSKEWLSDLVLELSAIAGVAWYSVSTGRNLPPSIMRLGGFLSAFLSSLESDDVTLTRSDQNICLVDTNPSRRFAAATTGFRSLVLLSATINPPRLFLRSIGLNPSTKIHSATTDQGFQIKTVIDCSVSTRFKMRTPEMLAEVASRLAHVVASTPRGVGIFLPSYAYLEHLKPVLVSEIKSRDTDQHGRKLLAERRNLSNQDSDAMMSAFKSDRRPVLLAVQGGRFSEGEDFPGESMDASIVVGLSLPPPSPTLFADYRQMENDLFDKTEAYMVLSLLPALRKAIQAAGRHVRNPGKVGMVFFFDHRFGDQKIVDLMPSWLRADMLKGEFAPGQLGEMTRAFFSRVGPSRPS